MKNKEPLTKEEFCRRMMQYQREREKHREGVYLGYLKEQKMKEKSRRKKHLKSKPKRNF